MQRLPRGVIILGFVSMLMDVSSEMIHGLLPVYLSVGLGASMITIGLIEGVAEATSAIVKIFSGVASDYLRKRKLLMGIGYGIAALTKPIFPLVHSIDWIFGARFLDRIGKGIRGAPRDALIADITPRELHGAAYGLRQSMDTVGAFIGPLLAIAFMALGGDDFRMVFWIAMIPGFAAWALVIFGVKDAEESHTVSAVPASRMDWRELRHFNAAYWTAVGVAAALTLARFSEAFLILRAQQLGLALTLTPLVLVVMNIVYSASAYPAGSISDGRNRLHLIAAGLIILITGDLLMAFSDNLYVLAFGVVLWGLHMGLTQGLLSALVDDTAPQHLRGTGFGLFNLITGIVMLAASIIAGVLWQGYGANATFAAGAVFAALSLFGLIWLSRGKP